MKIACVVSGNGYGHLKRSCTLAEELFRAAPATEITLLGAGAHEPMLAAWGYTEKFKPHRFTFLNAGLDKNLRAVLPSGYTAEQYYTAWEQTFAHLRQLRADVVVSDNLIGILEQYPQAVLVSSFLWPDILRQKYPGNTEIEKICTYEEALLHRHNPVMLGVADMVMPYVPAHTRFKGLPWFCERVPASAKATPHRVLITGGGTNLAGMRLLEIARSLVGNPETTVLLDRGLYYTLDEDEQREFERFDFTEMGFQSLAWIICRPGLGILTEAVQHAVPVCAVEEEDAEMKFNTARVVDLGIGVRAPEEAGAISGWLAKASRAACINNIRNLETGGAAQAARFILSC